MDGSTVVEVRPIEHSGSYRLPQCMLNQTVGPTLGGQPKDRIASAVTPTATKDAPDVEEGAHGVHGADRGAQVVAALLKSDPAQSNRARRRPPRSRPAR